MKLLLASSSVYRRELLARLQIPFDYASPDIDERPIDNELPHEYVARLAIEKARALRNVYPEHWIIGCDQCCVINGQIVGKPLSEARAVQQLIKSSGQRIEFLTGLCLTSPEGQQWSLVEPFYVHFRTLTQSDIERYVALEKPLDCAGSFKVEGLGINLFERLEGRDPNSLIGLPMIGLIELLRRAGLNPLNLAQPSH